MTATAPLQRVPASSWTPVDLAPILTAIASGEQVGPVPELMPRTDGLALLYPGEVHSLAGEPESGKGWVACAEAARLLSGDEHVLYLDFEDTAPNVASRLLALGAPAAAIVTRFTYVQPHDVLPPDALPALLHGRTHRLAVLDGMTEAYELLGLDGHSNQDAATFLRRLARPIAETGAAVVLIDHVTKDREGRSRFALGAGHKLAGVAVAYGVEAIERPSRRHPGRVKLTLAKDRHGAIPGARGATIALATITPADDGERVTVTLDPPDSTDTAGNFRPTNLMEKVSRFVEQHPGATRNDIKNGVGSNHSARDLAVTILVDEGWIGREKDGQAQRHTALRPYRESTNPGPTGPTGPNRSRTGPGDQSGATGPTGPSPLRGGPGPGPVAGDRSRSQPVPDPDAELQRLIDKGMTP